MVDVDDSNLLTKDFSSILIVDNPTTASSPPDNPKEIDMSVRMLSKNTKDEPNLIYIDDSEEEEKVEDRFDFTNKHFSKKRDRKYLDKYLRKSEDSDTHRSIHSSLDTFSKSSSV